MSCEYFAENVWYYVNVRPKPKNNIFFSKYKMTYIINPIFIMQSRLYISIQYVNIFQFLWLEKIRNGGFRRTKCTSKTMYVRNHVRPKPVFGACIMHQRQLNPFLIHVFIKRRQAAYMRDRQRAADGVNIIVQVNFSENATLQNQNEIQTAHWSHNQATLFTAYAWIDVSEDITESMVIVSDDLQHNKQSVHMFMTVMTHIFCTLKAKYPTIEQISVFSDGASSQFKPRFLFSNLYEWETEFGVKISWHFFATSHGKGVVDGLGGMVKRTVWSYVRAGAATATTPKAFYEVAVARNPGVRIDYITKEEIMINSQKAKLVESWNERLLQFPIHRSCTLSGQWAENTSRLQTLPTQMIGPLFKSAKSLTLKLKPIQSQRLK